MSTSRIVDRFDEYLAISRRGYPIYGPPKLRLFDATKHAYKPVYLRLQILRGRSQDQSGQSEGGPEPGPEPDPGPVSRTSIQDPDPSTSDLSNIPLNPSQTAV